MIFDSSSYSELVTFFKVVHNKYNTICLRSFLPINTNKLVASSLSKSTDLARKFIIFFIVFVIVVFVFDAFLQLLTPSTTPPSGIDVSSTGYLPADNLFGQLPKQAITAIPISPDTRAEYALTSILPSFPQVANVYKLLRPAETFGSVPRAINAANRLGFEGESFRNTSENVLFWGTNNNTRTLTYNKVIEDWIYNVDTLKDPIGNLPNKNLELDKNFYQLRAGSLMNQLGLGDNYFNQANSRVDFVNRNVEGQLSPVLRAIDARYVRIALYKTIESASLRENYKPEENDDNPSQTILSDIRKQSYIEAPAVFLIQGKGDNLNEDIIQFKHRQFDIGERAVYVTITAEQAWNRIQANQGYLYWLRPQDKNPFTSSESVRVTRFDALPEKTKIIYIEPDSWEANIPSTQFLQPYYMFEGIAKLEDGREAEFAFVIEALAAGNYLTE